MRGRLQGELPGGIPTPQGVRRDYAFRPPDGRLEMRLAEIAQEADAMPRAVTLALAASLAQLGGAAPAEATIDALCVADRQFLMRALAGLLGHSGGWYHAGCGHCGTPFDFRLEHTDLPVKPAGAAYPYARVSLAGQTLTLRLPTGADQIHLLALPEAERPGALLRALVVEAPVGPDWPDPLPPEAVDTIEAALEAVSPALVLAVAAPCPDCGETNPVGLNPYEVLYLGATDLLDEVHRLAWHYHWSEAEILGLPRARREQYLRRIDAARGLVQ